ncbi:hypothetical protein [Oceaniovalibus sp. ACAM 378]|uniref:hypothetical protein n=1 Tax=Oceaniovalibus sp. ACAM 378 TaxID=2599923 RepID=UPI0011D9E63F|nr:hypothetical protein [Oceaniovalibus sp. ACAM 378]TYB83879.1 hypothetical protein FQ320_23760 [Oceaniovalibus sp. ACAM 378]
MAFFLDDVLQTASQAFEAATQIVALFKADRDRITADSDRAGSSQRVHEWLQSNPFVTSNQWLGIVTEVTRKRRNRVFSYQSYPDILSEGTAPV